MKRPLRALLLALALLFAVAQAQQVTDLSGIILSDEPLAENSRVAIHLVDSDNVWGLEIVSVVPVGGTFRVQPGEVPASELRPFRSGSVILPGLQNEYRVTPGDVNVAVARFSVYVDQNGNEQFDRVIDRFYIGLASLENPTGFYTLLYVDKAATLVATGTELEVKAGWNVFTVRFPDEKPTYSVTQSVSDILLDVSLQ